MNTTIDDKKLEALKDLMLSTEGRCTAAQIGKLKIPAAELGAYQAELEVRWPEQFGEEQPSAPEAAAAAAPESVVDKPVVAADPKPQAKTRPPAVKAYRFIDDKNLVSDLEVAKESDTTVFLRKPVVRDMVTLTLRGRQITVDLEELAKHGRGDLHPIHQATYGTLKDLAEAAKP